MAIVLAAALLGACDDDLGLVCTTEFVYGLNLTVLDGQGGPAAQGATGIAIDGAYSETLMVLEPETMVGAGERAGTYDITVTKPGYVTWSADDVTVTENECHVNPVTLQANLIPVP